MNYKKVLITGSSGFIGSHVADKLEKAGLEVVLFDNKPSKFKTKNQKEIIGDIMHFENLEVAMVGCDAVFHFAAQADIEKSNISPLDTIKSNIIGTQNVIEAAINQNVDRLLFASTIYVYSELGGFYRVSKQACEKIIEEYQRQNNFNYTILRFGSLYGPRANKFNGIRSLLLQALKNKKIIRSGNGEEVREYIHVEDAALMSVKALDNNFINKHLIITGNQQIKVKDLLSMINEIMDKKLNIEYDNNHNTHHYKITPYNYKPQIAEKIIPDSYYDLGQGLMDQIYDIERELNNNIQNKK